jgi:hypothetical protein
MVIEDGGHRRNGIVGDNELLEVVKNIPVALWVSILAVSVESNAKVLI